MAGFNYPDGIGQIQWLSIETQRGCGLYGRTFRPVSSHEPNDTGLTIAFLIAPRPVDQRHVLIVGDSLDYALAHYDRLPADASDEAVAGVADWIDLDTECELARVIGVFSTIDDAKQAAANERQPNPQITVFEPRR